MCPPPGIKTPHHSSACIDAKHTRHRRSRNIQGNEPIRGQYKTVNADGVTVCSNDIAGWVHIPRRGRAASGHNQWLEFPVVDHVSRTPIAGRVVVKADDASKVRRSTVVHGAEGLRLAVITHTQHGAPHACAEIVVMPASEDRPIRQDSLRNRVRIWWGVDALESSVTGAQETVKVHGGLALHLIRAHDFAVGADAQSYGEDRTGETDRREFVVAEHEAMSPRRVVVGSDDLTPIVDSPCYRSLRAGNFNGSEIKAALDCGESC